MTDKIVSKQIPLERKYPADLQSHFVSNLVVQFLPDHFILSFFEVWPPAIIADTDAEKQHALNSVDHIDANCIARIVLTPARMKEFIQLLNDNYGKFEMMQEQGEWLKDG